MCSSCVGLTAALYCEQCLDSFCTQCFASLHSLGRLARHTSYEVEQPGGGAADVELLVRHPDPLVAAAAAVSVGQELVGRAQAARAEGGTGEQEGLTPAQLHQRALLQRRALDTQQVVEEKVSLGDISRYIKRGKALGTLPASLQMKVRLQSKEAVEAAAHSLLTEQAAMAVGGWGVLKNQRPDEWMSGVVVSGAGITQYK